MATSQVLTLCLCPTKLSIIVTILDKCLSYKEISAILSILRFLFSHFLKLILEIMSIMWENFIFLVIFDTWDVVYKWSISLLPPFVLENLFGKLHNFLLVPRDGSDSLSKYQFTIHWGLTCFDGVNWGKCHNSSRDHDNWAENSQCQFFRIKPDHLVKLEISRDW